MTKRAARSPLLSLALDRSANGSLQAQIFDQIRDGILAGRLKPGAVLPASRTLAQELSVSRNTVLGAFDRLHAEGYIEGRTGAGTQVSTVLPEDLLAARHGKRGDPGGNRRRGKVSRLSLSVRDAGHGGAGRAARAFRPGLPDLENFPFQLWSRLIARFWRHPPINLLVGGDLGGYLPLRQSIADYLGGVRGMQCEGEQIIITSGAQQALDLIARAVIDTGDRVWVENPGYEGLRATLSAAGAEICHVRVDDQGISVSHGKELASNAVLAAVTPSHQYPLGVTMSLTRRLELLDWAAEAGAWILEDDYDSEFRYAGKPLSALHGLDNDGRVIYVGTFSKVLFPSLRLGYVVVPEALLDRFLAVRSAVDDQPALALQPALHAFIDEGYFASHVRRLRGLYVSRQQVLLDCLAEFEGGISAESHETGMHLVAQLSSRLSGADKDISAKAAARGIEAPALSSFYADGASREGLLLGYAGLSENEIKDGVAQLLGLF